MIHRTPQLAVLMTQAAGCDLAPWTSPCLMFPQTLLPPVLKDSVTVTSARLAPGAVRVGSFVPICRV